MCFQNRRDTPLGVPVVVIEALLLTLGVLAGCGAASTGGGSKQAIEPPATTAPTTPTAPATLATHALGERVELGNGLAVTVESATTISNYEQTGLTDNQWEIRFIVRVTNTGSQVGDISNDDFTLRDPSGQALRSYYISDVSELHGPIAPGQTVRGAVAAQGPAGVTGDYILGLAGPSMPDGLVLWTAPMR